MNSAYLNSQQLRGLEKTGDVMIPGGGEFPSFKQLGCIEHVDRIMEYMTEHDLADFRSLMGVFAFLPRFLIRALMSLTSSNHLFPGPIGGTLRLLELGVKGVVMTLYYSDLHGSSYRGRSIHELIGYDARIVTQLK
jgi:hypothetical protein